MSNRTKNRPTKATTTPRAAPPEDVSTEAPPKASEGGMDLNKVIARYEQRIGKLTTENILQAEQLEGMQIEVAELKEALDDLVSRLPKSEPGHQASNGAPRKTTPRKSTPRKTTAKQGEGQ